MLPRDARPGKVRTGSPVRRATADPSSLQKREGTMPRTRILILLAALVAACAPTSTEAPEKPGRYVRPDVPKLLAEAVRREPTEDGPEDFANWGKLWMERPVYRAVWSAIEKAEERGLHELYGVEMFLAGESTDYEALFFLRTAEGTTCLYGRHDLHAARPDPATVPCRPVPAGVLEKLRARVAVEVPFPIRSDRTSQVLDGADFLIHVFRDGESHAALWYEPRFEPHAGRELVAEGARAHPVVAVLGALWAAAPPEHFHYDWDLTELPDDRLWESDAQEVYGRAPGYR
jgi:hypothetical protein